MSFPELMLDMLTSAYNRTDVARFREGKPPETNIGKLFGLCGWGFDILREHTEKVRLWDDLDRMRGSTLERFGKDFGVERGTAGDETLRVMIRVKILAMLAAGNLDTLILAAASLFGIAPENVGHEEIYPAKVYLYIDEDKLDQEHRGVAGIIAGLMHRIKAAGVGIKVFYRTYRQVHGGVRLAALTEETVHLTATADADDSYVKRKTDVHACTPTLVYVRRMFLPSDEESELLRLKFLI